MNLLNYWESLLIIGFSNEDNAKDNRAYFNHCSGVIHAGLGP